MPTARHVSEPLLVVEVWSSLLLVLGGVGMAPPVFYWILTVMHLEERLNLISLSRRITQKTFYGLHTA